MKKYLIISLTILSFQSLSAKDNPSLGLLEVYLNNFSTTRSVRITIYPISFNFNGDFRYDVVSTNALPTTVNPYYTYNNGVRRQDGQKITYITLPPNTHNDSYGYNFDDNDNNGGCFGSVSYGRYKIMFNWHADPEANFEGDTLQMEWDDTPAGGDVHLNFRDDNDNPRITYKMGLIGGFPERLISDTSINRHFKIWRPYGYNPPTGWTINRNKDFGDFHYVKMDYFSHGIPLDSRKDCNVTSLAGNPLNQDHIFSDNRSGILTLNLTFDTNFTTRDTLVDNPTFIGITTGAALKIKSGKGFTMTTPLYPSTGYTNLIVQNSAYLILYNASEIIMQSPNRLTLEYNGHLTLGANSVITVQSGAQFCNLGGKIHGPGKIWYKGGFHSFCRPDNGIITFEDSANVILDSNVVLEIPDSTTLKFKGSQTALRLFPTSKLKMGVNSKLVFEDGARMISRNSTLIAKDTTKKWKGIFSYDNATDSITNTKIVNAEDGINIIDNFSDRKIIKDCEFINKSSSNLNSCINVYNSSRTLIRGNHFYSETSANFDNAIYLEYCTSDELNIIDNTIEDATNGIIDIGSWSYIARNTITGDEGSGNGITLDNYSGTIKYNSIENFSYSLYALISDAYLYRNIFQNASDVNLELESYSIPLLRPVQSGELKYWLGGDNVIDIATHGVGINLITDSYPLIKDGFNKFYLNDAYYFISGEVPAEFEDSLEARNNYWNASVNSSKFDISNTTVKFSPTEDGSSGNRYYNTTILMDIGFGLWDTINIHDESDNSLITNLFLLGNNNLMAGDYEDAVEDFKEIVTSKDSVFTNLALKKVYYCYERSNFFSSNYTDAKNYFNGINTDTNYSATSRAIARDLYLKVKFKNSEYESAEDEYNTIYENNTNNSLGIHALINKTILGNLVSGDNLGNEETNLTKLTEHKKQIIELLNPNENSASRGNHETSTLVNEFRLEQNYPNPFNPTTNISFNIQYDNFVNIRVYDILGKEVKLLVNEFKPAGSYNISFDGSDLSNGIYFYRMEAGDFIQVKKMIMVK